MNNTQKAIKSILEYFNSGNHLPVESATIKADSAEVLALRAVLEEPVPPFGTKRKAAMAVYTPPFRYKSGYIFDSQNLMVADDDQVEGAVASRVRGWGRFGYMPNGAALQDEVGQMLADALNAYYAAPAPEPVNHDLLVTSIMLAVVPGEDGSGVEIYAKSAMDVEDTLTKLGSELEEWQLGIRRLAAQVREPAPEPVAWNGLTDVQWMNIVNKNSAWLGYSVEDAVHEVVRLTEARLKANNAAPVLGAAPKPVASIYITPDGQREVDDWKVALPVGRNELYAAPVREPVPVPQPSKLPKFLHGDLVSLKGERQYLGGVRRTATNPGFVDVHRDWYPYGEKPIKTYQEDELELWEITQTVSARSPVALLTDAEISDLSHEMVKGCKSVNWLAGKIEALVHQKARL